MIAVACGDAKVYRYTNLGSEVWAHNMNSAVLSVSVTEDGRLIGAGTKEFLITVLDPEGQKVWSYKINGQVFGLDLSPPDGPTSLQGEMMPIPMSLMTKARS